MKTKFTVSIILLVVGLGLMGKAAQIVWILSRIEFHGGAVRPGWVPIVCLLFASGFILDAIGNAMFFTWWRTRMNDKTQRPNRALEWFHLRFRVRRPGGLPWHGLKKFDAKMAANILLAGRKYSAFAELFEIRPEVAELISTDAYLGRSQEDIFKSCTICFGELIHEHEGDVVNAIAEAIEIYSPKP